MTRKYPIGTPCRFPRTRSVRRTGGFVQVAFPLTDLYDVLQRGSGELMLGFRSPILSAPSEQESATPASQLSDWELVIDDWCRPAVMMTTTAEPQSGKTLVNTRGVREYNSASRKSCT